MLETYIIIKPAIDHTISKHPDEFINITLSDNEIILIKQLIEVLKPFLYASTELQKQKEPIFILSHLTITKLYQHLNQLIQTINSAEIKIGLKKGLSKLKKYFPQDHNLNIYDIYAFSIILDPRFKLNFLQKKLNYSATNMQFLKQRLLRLYETYSNRYKDFNSISDEEDITGDLEVKKSYKDQLLNEFT